jgi:hypothetical protein
MRAQLLTRVINDFIYKKDFTEVQGRQWDVVKQRFDGFREEMDRLLRNADISPLFREKDEHLGYRLALRETERWCNTAIANDSETGDPVDLTKYGVEVPEYTGPSGGGTPRHKICDTISLKCFDLIVYLVSVLPMGRALSVAVTRMQDVRGWLLDTVNVYYFETNNKGEV